MATYASLFFTLLKKMCGGCVGFDAAGVDRVVGNVASVLLFGVSGVVLSHVDIVAVSAVPASSGVASVVAGVG